MGDFSSICVGKSCGWNSFSKTIGCSSGDGSCLTAEFLTADESEFHTTDLMEATTQIRNALSSVKRRDDRKLALINTPFGVLLAWVQHDIDVPTGSINIESPPEEIIKALGLRDVQPDREQAN